MAKRRSRSRRRVSASFRLSPPTNQVFLVCLALIVLGIVGQFVVIPFVSAYSFWFVAAGGVVLLLACLLTGL